MTTAVLKLTISGDFGSTPKHVIEYLRNELDNDSNIDNYSIEELE